MLPKSMYFIWSRRRAYKPRIQWPIKSCQGQPKHVPSHCHPTYRIHEILRKDFILRDTRDWSKRVPSLTALNTSQTVFRDSLNLFTSNFGDIAESRMCNSELLRRKGVVGLMGAEPGLWGRGGLEPTLRILQWCRTVPGSSDSYEGIN